MGSMNAVVARHPAGTYFVATFAISWTGVLLIIGGFDGMNGVMAQDNPLFPFAVLAMLAGPSVTGLGLTACLQGKEGLRELGTRLRRWRVPLRWYALALLTAPLLATALALTLSMTSPEFFPAVAVTRDRVSLLVLGLVVALPAGLLEEVGWTGSAAPLLRRNHGIYATGLIVGLLWSAWHFLVVVWGIGDRAGTLPLALFVIIDALGVLPAYRVLMVSVYDRSQSLLLAVVMHVSLTATTLILAPRTLGVSLLFYGVLFAAGVWAVTMVINHGRAHADPEPTRQTAHIGAHGASLQRH
jgi:uncharacterized protein